MVLTFKAFSHFNIPTFPALLSNYFTAGSWCLYYGNESLSALVHRPEQPWFELTFLLGLLFIIVFYATALTAQKVAVSVSVVAGKMSVVIPVLFAWYMWDGMLNWVSWVGIIGALVSVIFTTRRKEKSKLSGGFIWLFPAVVFFGSGIVDSALNYLQHGHKGDLNAPLGTIFYLAFLWGALALIGIGISKKKLEFPLRAWVGGFVLGTLNYVSTLTLLIALKSQILPSTLLFPVANVGIVVLATLGAILLFREKLSKLNFLGVGLSVLFILIIAQSEKISRLF